MHSRLYNSFLRIAILIIFAFALGLLMALIQNIFEFELRPIYRMIIAVVLIITLMGYLSKKIR